jgi:hypothetical protein
VPPQELKGPADPETGGFLTKLPPNHEALVHQERDRLGRLLAAVLVDQKVTLADLILVILADLEGDLGKAVAAVLMSLDEVREEFRAASEGRRRPVVLEVLVRDRAVEFINEVMPELLDYVRLRPPFAFVLLVVDREDDPSVTMAVPTTCKVVSGGGVH